MRAKNGLKCKPFGVAVPPEEPVTDALVEPGRALPRPVHVGVQRSVKLELLPVVDSPQRTERLGQHEVKPALNAVELSLGRPSAQRLSDRRRNTAFEDAPHGLPPQNGHNKDHAGYNIGFHR